MPSPLHAARHMPRLAALLCLLLTPAFAAGQTINLGPGESIADGTDIPTGATVNVDGGTIGLGVDLAGGTLNINSGSVALGANSIATGFTNTGNTINLNGGSVGGFFQLNGGTELTIRGGQIESFGLFNPTGAASPANRATITAGAITRFPDIGNGGVVDVFGGDVFSARVFAGGTLNVFGSAIGINGVPIAGLTNVGDSVVISQRGANVTLTATLADGSPFETDLNPAFGGFFSANPDGAATSATITATLTSITGDANLDGSVNAADFVAVRDTLGATVATPFAAGDENGDLLISTADLEIFRQQFGASGGPTPVSPVALPALAIPEPGAAIIAALGLAAMLVSRKRPL